MKVFKILTINGSPHDSKSNTRAFLEDFIDEMRNAGLEIEHEIISLGKSNVNPCIGCWACTRGKACPIGDDLNKIKESMLDCDMLILASPVYTNQITAQMKALFDRLFTWCHIYPLLGKYSMSVVTTGNEGHKTTGDFLEKMLATYGTYSFGTLSTIGGFTPGFFPWRNIARDKNKSFAQNVAGTIINEKRPEAKAIQRKIFKTMKRKMDGIHTVNCMVNGVPEGQPEPQWLRVKLMKLIMKRIELSDKDLQKWSNILAFELSWWRDRGWFGARNLKQLEETRIPKDFDFKSRLIH